MYIPNIEKVLFWNMVSRVLPVLQSSGVCCTVGAHLAYTQIYHKAGSSALTRPHCRAVFPGKPIWNVQQYHAWRPNSPFNHTVVHTTSTTCLCECSFLTACPPMASASHNRDKSPCVAVSMSAPSVTSRKLKTIWKN